MGGIPVAQPHAWQMDPFRSPAIPERSVTDTREPRSDRGTRGEPESMIQATEVRAYLSRALGCLVFQALTRLLR
jgi:hypothetical protein